MSAQHSDTYGVTKEDVKKAQSQASAATGGDVPRTSNAAMLQSIVDERTPQGEAHTSKLPKPDPAPGSVRSDEYQQTTAGIGSGRMTGVPGTEKNAMREPVATGSAVREDGKTLHKATDV